MVCNVIAESVHILSQFFDVEIILFRVFFQTMVVTALFEEIVEDNVLAVFVFLEFALYFSIDLIIGITSFRKVLDTDFIYTAADGHGITGIRESTKNYFITQHIWNC